MPVAEVQTIQAARLTERQGATKVGSIRSPHRDDVASSLTPQRLARLMRDADQGNIVAYLTLAQEMEERDLHYRSVIHTRKMAVSAITPVLELPKDDSVSKEIAQHVEDRIIHSPKFEGLVFDMMDGVAKGFSCVEIIWKLDANEWYPVDYKFSEQRHFTFDRDTMETPLLRSDDVRRLDEEEEGVPLRPYQWIVHKPKIASGIPIRTGLARTAAVGYACKRWTVADWMAFLDIFGIPIRLGKYPQSMAEKRKELLRAILQIGSDAAAVIPEEMQLELIEAGKGSGGSGAIVFEQTATYWDKQQSKLVLGQTMSTDDGSSLAQSKTHETVRWDIRDMDGRQAAAAINEQLIEPFVMLNHGLQKVYPKVRLYQRRPEETEPLMRSTEVFVKLGGKVQASEVRDRLGFMEPEEGAELLQPAAPPAPPPGDPKETEGDETEPSDPVEEDDEIEKDGRDIELNREERAALAQAIRDFDAADEATREALSEWRPLLEGNVGRLLRELQEARSFEEARAKLEELMRDQGDVLDLGALVVSLSRQLFKVRGIGSATDEVKP